MTRKLFKPSCACPNCRYQDFTGVVELVRRLPRRKNEQQRPWALCRAPDGDELVGDLDDLSSGGAAA